MRCKLFRKVGGLEKTKECFPQAIWGLDDNARRLEDKIDPVVSNKTRDNLWHN